MRIALLLTSLLGTDLSEAVLEAIENVWRKVQLFSIGVLHFLFSSDKQWPKIEPSNGPFTPSSAVSPRLGSTVLPYGSDTVKTRKKRIVFVRHAESEWNVVFNRGVWWLAIVRFFRAVVREWLMLPTTGSIFIDSPLSRRGIRQAKTLYAEVAEKTSPPEYMGTPPDHLLRYLSCPLPNSIIVTSNLRRAIDTARIASAARLELPGERIHVLSSLQEIGRNIDTLAISEAYSVPPQALTSMLQGEKHAEELFNLAENHGNKAILGSARSRLVTFAKWVFYQDEHDTIVVYGHSHWFRAFCQEFFPAGADHPVKSEKLLNCAVVSFELEERRSDGTARYVIPPATFEYVR